ncbi:hypothetical protein GCM10020220_092650 [Nonomuraea rubra]|uniref:SDR family NAD(P)-dependent oxidoreductase n=1 Tax=Nonomuraea rubra TaxID=46180 RepID=UPI00336F6603
MLSLAQEGCNVVACYRGDAEAAARLEKDLAATPGKHSVVQADVGRADQVARLIDECRTGLGSLDVVVHNAGAISHVPFAQLELTEWQRVLDTNLTGMYLVLHGALPLMSEGGSVVAIGSKAAMVGVPLRTHYTASKAGVLGLARSLCKELGPNGIRINVIAPRHHLHPRRRGAQPRAGAALPQHDRARPARRAGGDRRRRAVPGERPLPLHVRRDRARRWRDLRWLTRRCSG